MLLRGQGRGVLNPQSPPQSAIYSFAAFGSGFEMTFPRGLNWEPGGFLEAPSHLEPRLTSLLGSEAPELIRIYQ
jgi:hypothetical protein